MGRCPSNKNSGQKSKKHLHKRARLAKFLVKGDDIIHDELGKTAERGEREGAASAPVLALNEDLPGMGQWYCLHCDRYFASSSVRDEHYKTKLHRKRVKLMKGPKPHNQLDADLAGGMGLPDNGPRLRSEEPVVAMAL